MFFIKNKNFIIFACFFILVSCQKDENKDQKCTIKDWVGTYSGSGTCFGKTEKVKLFFKQGASQDEVLISNGKIERPAKFSNCTIQVTEDTPFFSFPVTGTAVLKGDSLKLTASTSFGLSCTTTIGRE